MDHLYTNGVIAVKECSLLKDKVSRLAELNSEDGLRLLSESGFGSGGEGEEIESLLQHEEASLDDFIRVYAPSDSERVYLLCPRDFHNAKAIIKAEALGIDATNMLSPDGTIPVGQLAECIRAKKYDGLDEELKSALAEADKLFEDDKRPSGAEIGILFERALYKRLMRGAKRNKHLKQLIRQKIDMINILTFFRAGSAEQAKSLGIEGGSLPFDKLEVLFKADEEIVRAFEGTPYSAYVGMLVEDRNSARPFTDAEKILFSLEAEYFYAMRFETSTTLPFLSYVFRRRTEIENVRLIFVCRAAGLAEADIKRRLKMA